VTLTRSALPTDAQGLEARIDLAAHDRQLVRRAALGATEAWEALVARHAQAVWEVARSAQLRVEEAGAVCEVVWLLLAEALPDLDGLPVAVWLRRTATTESHLAYLRAHPRATPGDRRRQPRELSG
jgi:hypothetical protein